MASRGVRMADPRIGGPPRRGIILGGVCDARVKGRRLYEEVVGMSVREECSNGACRLELQLGRAR